MNDVNLQQEVECSAKHTSYIHELFDKAEGILQQHRHENPDLYQIIEERKCMLLKEENEKQAITPPTTISQEVGKTSVPELIESIYFKHSKQVQLKARIKASHQLIHAHHLATLIRLTLQLE